MFSLLIFKPNIRLSKLDEKYDWMKMETVSFVHLDSEFLSGLGPQRHAHGPDEPSEAVEQRIFADLFSVDPSQNARAAPAQTALENKILKLYLIGWDRGLPKYVEHIGAYSCILSNRNFLFIRIFY